MKNCKSTEQAKNELSYSSVAKYISYFFISLFFSVIVASIVYIIGSAYDTALLNAINNGEIQSVINPEALNPESREMYSYVAFFIFFVLSFILCGTLLNKKLQGVFVFTEKLLSKNKIVNVICFSGIFAGLFLLSHYFFQWYGLIWVGCVSIIMGVLFLLVKKRKSGFDKIELFVEKRKNIFKAGTYILCGFLFIFVLFFYFSTNSFTFLESFHHFSAYYYSVFDVYNGSTLMVDTNSIYGFYAYCLMPYFRLFGLSFVSFTIAMLIIFAVILVCVFYILKVITKNNLLIFLGFFAFCGYTLFYGMGHDGYLYLQYAPHRLLAPIVTLAYICRISQKDRLNSKINIIIGYALCSFCLVWNTETGIFSLASYCFFIIYMKADSYDKICKHLIIDVIKYVLFAAIALLAAVAFILLVTLIKSGKVINVLPTVMGIQGFLMLPLPAWPHLYMVIILTYVIALSVSIFKLKALSQKKETTINSALLFTFAVLGILSFVYYLGRSHDYNLIPCTWACIFLAIYFLDYSEKKISARRAKESCSIDETTDEQDADEARISAGMQKAKSGKRLLLPGLQIAVACVLIVFAAFPVTIPAQNQLTQNYLSTKTAVSADFVQNKAFIQEAFANKDSLFLISQNSSLYLTEIKLAQKFKYKNNCDWFNLQDYEDALLKIAEIDEDFIISSRILNEFEKFCLEKYENIFEKFEIKSQSGNPLENLILFSPK